VRRRACLAFQCYIPHGFYPRLFLSSLKMSLPMTVYRETQGRRSSTPGFAAVSLERTNPLFACGRSFCTPRYPGRRGWVPRCRVRSEVWNVRRMSAHRNSVMVSPANSLESVRRIPQAHCRMRRDLYEVLEPFVLKTEMLISSGDFGGAAVQR